MFINNGWHLYQKEYYAVMDSYKVHLCVLT